MENSSLISVILPTYNRARLLRRAIQSILNQTYQNFEIIVVDDCSNDNTEEVVKSFCDKRIRYIRNRRHMGAPFSRNIGIKVAHGKYIAFQDSDDIWLPKKLAKQINAFENSPKEVGVVYTSFWRIEEGKKVRIPPSNFRQYEGNIHEILLETNFIGTSAAMVKKECFEKVGMFDETLPRLQEWDLWIRISRYYLFRHINEPLVICHLQSDSISRNTNAYIQALKRISEKYFEEMLKKPKILGKHYYEIGILLCLNGEIQEGKSYFFKAVKTYPNIKLLLSTVLSLSRLRSI
ncbi:MAG: glycosyltransferase family 2 protein [Candidatus Methanodesulfokora washburnensis]